MRLTLSRRIRFREFVLTEDEGFLPRTTFTGTISAVKAPDSIAAAVYAVNVAPVHPAFHG